MPHCPVTVVYPPSFSIHATFISFIFAITVDTYLYLFSYFFRYAARGDRTRTAPLRCYATNLYAMLHSLIINRVHSTTTVITRVRAGKVGGAHYPNWRRSLRPEIFTRDVGLEKNDCLGTMHTSD